MLRPQGLSLEHQRLCSVSGWKDSVVSGPACPSFSIQVRQELLSRKRVVLQETHSIATSGCPLECDLYKLRYKSYIILLMHESMN